MRRKDRDITNNKARICALLDRTSHMVLTIPDDSMPYTVPISYGYEQTEQGFRFYFHCAKEGRKVTLLQQYSTIGVCVCRAAELIKSDISCKYGTEFESLLGTGTACEITDPNEKIHALTVLLKRYDANAPIHFGEKILAATKVYAIDVKDYTAKANFELEETK